jgi:cytochrome c oxidase subunit IV
MSANVHAAHGEAHGHGDGHGSHFIVPAKTYYMVYGGLMILTVITVAAYYLPDVLSRIVGQPVELGAANVVIAMAIATAKASLVCLFFMQLKYDKKFNLIAFLSSLIFLGLFLGFTLLDIKFREEAEPFGVRPSAAAPAPAPAASPSGAQPMGSTGGGNQGTAGAPTPTPSASPAASPRTGSH